MKQTTEAEVPQERTLTYPAKTHKINRASGYLCQMLGGVVAATSICIKKHRNERFGAVAEMLLMEPVLNRSEYSIRPDRLIRSMAEHQRTMFATPWRLCVARPGQLST